MPIKFPANIVVTISEKLNDIPIFSVQEMVLKKKNQSKGNISEHTN